MPRQQSSSHHLNLWLPALPSKKTNKMNEAGRRSPQLEYIEDHAPTVHKSPVLEELGEQAEWRKQGENTSAWANEERRLAEETRRVEEQRKLEETRKSDEHRQRQDALQRQKFLHRQEELPEHEEERLRNELHEGFNKQILEQEKANPLEDPSERKMTSLLRDIQEPQDIKEVQEEVTQQL